MRRFFIFFILLVFCFISCSTGADSITPKGKSTVMNDNEEQNNTSENNNPNQNENENGNENPSQNNENNNQNENGNTSENNVNENQNQNDNPNENQTGQDNPVITTPSVQYDIDYDNWIKMDKTSNFEYSFSFDSSENRFADLKIVICTNRVHNYDDYIFECVYNDGSTWNVMIENNNQWVNKKCHRNVVNFIDYSLTEQRFYILGEYDIQYKILKFYITTYNENTRYYYPYEVISDCYYSPDDKTLYFYGSVDDDPNVECYDIQEDWIKLGHPNESNKRMHILKVNNGAYENMDGTSPKVPVFYVGDNTEKSYIQGFVFCESDKLNYNDYNDSNLATYVYKTSPITDKSLNDFCYMRFDVSYKNQTFMMSLCSSDNDVYFSIDDQYGYFDVYYDTKTEMFYCYQIN